jgi:hypothetical protein
MSRSIRIAPAIGLALGLVPCWATAEDVCPKPLTGGGETRDGIYNLAYKSWNWKDQSSWVFCYCIRNVSASQHVYAEWQDVHLSGFIKPDGEIHTYSPYEKDSSQVINKTIWYGGGLKPTTYPTLFPKVSSSENRTFDVSFVRLITRDDIQYADYDSSLPERGIKSEGLIYLPILSYPMLSKTEIIAAVESGELSTVPFSMEFTSSWDVNKTTGKTEISYNCAYDSPLVNLRRLGHNAAFVGFKNGYNG